MWWEVWVILRKGVTLRSPYIERSIEGQTDFVFSSCYSQRNKTGMQFSDSQLKELQRWWYMRRVILAIIRCVCTVTLLFLLLCLCCVVLSGFASSCARGKERKGKAAAPLRGARMPAALLLKRLCEFSLLWWAKALSAHWRWLAMTWLTFPEAWGALTQPISLATASAAVISGWWALLSTPSSVQKRAPVHSLSDCCVMIA